jgi:hypothetical protein
VALESPLMESTYYLINYTEDSPIIRKKEGLAHSSQTKSKVTWIAGDISSGITI